MYMRAYDDVLQVARTKRDAVWYAKHHWYTLGFSMGRAYMGAAVAAGGANAEGTAGAAGVHKIEGADGGWGYTIPPPKLCASELD